MPLTGILKGDFSSFIDAVSKAEVALKGFEGDAGKVQTALNKMADSFSGKKIISDAELATKAVTEIGGATKLTAGEQARLNAQLNEAIAKYAALGAEAPDEMVKLANATKGAQKSTSDILGTVGKLAGAIGIGFSVGAVVNFAGKVFDTASHIKDLSDKLAISTDAVQGFGYAAAQGGSDIDAVGGALEKMNENIGAGDKGTVAALGKLQLKFADISQMKPEDAFLAITDALEKIENPALQARLAVELFGKRGAELLPAIRDGFRGVSNEASKMSNDTIKSLEHAQQAWENLANKVIILTGNMIARAQDATSSWEKFAEFVAVASGTVSAEALKIQKDSDRIARALAVGHIPDVNLPAPGPPLKTQEQEEALKKYAEAVKALDAATKPLTETQKEWAVAFHNSGAAASELAPVLRISSTAVENFLASIENGKAVAEKWVDFNTTMATSSRKLASDFIASSQKLDEAAAHSKTDAQNKLLADLVKFYNKNQAARMTDTDAAIAEARRMADQTLESYRALVGESSPLFKLLADEIETDLAGKIFNLLPSQVATVGTAAKKAAVDFGSLSQALAQLAQVSGSTFGGIVSSLSQLVASANAAQKAITGIKEANAALKAGDALAGIAGMATGITSLVTAAVAAGQAIKALFGLFDRNKGRDAVVDFAESFGGFDALHKMLAEKLPEDAEKFWIALTQGVGRNNPAQAQRVIDEVTQALDDQAAKSDDAKSATEEQAQATIETATQAAKALDELGGKLDISKDQWKEWGLAVTGVLQQIANTVRSLPMPSPAGALPFSAGSNAGTSSTAGGGSAAGQETTVVIPLTIDGAVLAQSVVKVARRL